LPYGAGKVEIGSEKRIFDFDPATDVTYPRGRGTIRILTQSDNYIEVEDVFEGHINVPHVDFGDGVTGTGTGDFRYSLSIAIDPGRILTVTAATLSASLRTSDGKTLDFATDRRMDGSVRETNTMLDW